MKNSILKISALAFALSLTACGGGGSSDTSEPNTGGPTTPTEQAPLTSGSSGVWEWTMDGEVGSRLGFASSFNVPDSTQGQIGIESAIAVGCSETDGILLSIAVTDRTWDGYLYLSTAGLIAESEDNILAAPTVMSNGFEMGLVSEADSAVFINQMLQGDSTIAVQFTGVDSLVTYLYSSEGFAQSFAGACYWHPDFDGITFL